MPEVKFLKKLNTPEWDYHIATPILLQEASRLKKLFPYDPDTKKFIGMNGQLVPEHIDPGTASPEIQDESVVVGTERKEPSIGRLAKDEDAPVDPNRVAAILSVIPGLIDSEWTKKTANLPAMPRVDALTAHVGFDVTREERDAAHKEYTEKNAENIGG